MSNKTELQSYTTHELVEAAQAEIKAQKFEAAVLSIYKFLFSLEVSKNPIFDVPAKLEALEKLGYRFSVVSIFKKTKKGRNLLHTDLYVVLPTDVRPYCLGARLSDEYIRLMVYRLNLETREQNIDDDEEDAA